MTTTTKKSINRGYLLRQAKKGNVYVKCRFHFTDDYAYDNANGFGKDDEFRKVYIRTGSAEAEVLREEINRHYENTNHDDKWLSELSELQDKCRRLEWAHAEKERSENPGCIPMSETDFRYKSGHVHGDKQGGSFSIHSNLNYDYEIRS